MRPSASGLLSKSMSKTFKILALCAAILSATAAAAWAVDASNRQTIAKGITIAGVDVGGMGSTQSRDALEGRLSARLSAPVVVKAGRGTFVITPRRARVSIDIDSAVDQALAESRRGWLGSRVWRDLAGGRVDFAITPGVTVDRAAVADFSRRVAAKVYRAPVQPHLAYGPSSVSVVAGSPGVRISTAALASSIGSALVQPGGGSNTVIKAPLRTIQPAGTTAGLADRFPTVITVSRGDRRLYLFKHLKLARTFTVAVGMAGLETPAGLYSIQDKQTNPVWHVPNSPWAGKLAGKTIPAGPSNPIKARWMGVAASVGIHGTADDGSLGSAASHGCIRMNVKDVIWLYDQVPLGAPVYIS